MKREALMEALQDGVDDAEDVIAHGADSLAVSAAWLKELCETVQQKMGWVDDVDMVQTGSPGSYSETL